MVHLSRHWKNQDRQDGHMPLWEVVAWCVFALTSVSGLAYLVFVLFSVGLQHKDVTSHAFMGTETREFCNGH